jgi:hypothetical protein
MTVYKNIFARIECLTNDAAISIGYFNIAMRSIRERLLRLAFGNGLAMANTKT